MRTSSDTARRWWKFANYALMSIIIAATGIAVAVLRRRARNAYTMSYARGDNA